ncbi:MAG: polysaccharide biosynthesis/export family protein [Bacteroidetes bacterium]|nr:polysaccharide biosynthesis/export family protein [Bacteroidota bacterium]
MKKGLLAIVLLLITLSSCRTLRPNIMMKTPKEYKFDIPKDSSNPDYKIQPNDILDFRIFSNEGFKLIDLTSLNTNNAGVNANFSIEYNVEFDGKIKLPMLGRIAVSGLTVREAERMLEEKYADFYIKPFILLKVENRKVFVFTGGSNDAKVVPLTNDATNLLQVLASAGGISDNGKAYRVKLLRGELENPKVYLFDLSTIEGIKQSSINLQSNDIIYIEPVPKFGRSLVSEIAPYVSLISSLFIILTFSRSLQ